MDISLPFKIFKNNHIVYENMTPLATVTREKEIEKLLWFKTATTIVFPHIQVSFSEQNFLFILFNKKEVLLLNPKVLSIRK